MFPKTNKARVLCVCGTRTFILNFIFLLPVETNLELEMLKSQILAIGISHKGWLCPDSLSHALLL